MLVIVAAFGREIGGFLKAGRFRESERDGRIRFYESETAPGVAVAVGGFGRVGAAESVRRAVDKFAPEAMVCAGFSGGAIEGLGTGDVVVGCRTVALDGPSDARSADGARGLETDGRALDAVRDALAECDFVKYSVAPCLTARAFVSDPGMKRWLGETFGAWAIDMESYWAAAEAGRRGVPCVPVRVILDTVDQRVSGLVVDTLGDSGTRRALRAAGYLAARPKEAGELWRLRGQTRRARGALGDFLTGLVHCGGAVG